MLESVLITAQQTLILFILMGFGFAARRMKMFDDAFIQRLTSFELVFVTPCIIVASFQQPFETAKVSGLGWAFAAGTAGHLLGILFSRLFVHDRNEGRRRLLRYATIFSNAGFMGLPLEYALFGYDGVFYGIAYVAMFQVFCWTYGIRLMGGPGERRSLASTLFNSGTIGLYVGIPLFFLPWRLPEIVASPVRTIGSLNTPLPMLIIGYHLAGAKFGSVFRLPSFYQLLFSRHFAVPAALMTILLFCPFIDPTVRVVSIIPAAAPVGALATMFAIRYNREPAVATAVVAASTVFSILTLPLAAGLARVLFVR